MIPVSYAVLRTGRRLLPEPLVDWMRARHWFIVPGLETRDPERAVARYLESLERRGRSVEGQRVMVLGYGGSFGVAIGLLRAGAEHVTLVDPYVTPSRRANEQYLTGAKDYVKEVDGHIEAEPAYISISTQDACELAEEGDEFDLILSSSVLEHVADVRELVKCLEKMTAEGGAGLHFVDLRDHYFKFPFEMLCHSERVWRNLLDPTTHLNRLRLWDYERLFEDTFAQTEVEVLESDPQALRRIKHRVQPEFLSGDPERDSVTKIAVFCTS